MKIFVSSLQLYLPYAATLIEKLKAASFHVAHSPDPDMQDVRWGDWYVRGCAVEFDDTDIFIIVITFAWDSSTWMAHESDEALKRFRAGRIRRMFFYNPEGIEVTAAGMLPYLIKRLPDSPDEVVALLRQLKVELD
jgi:hypothetical protein